MMKYFNEIIFDFFLLHDAPMAPSKYGIKRELLCMHIKRYLNKGRPEAVEAVFVCSKTDNYRRAYDKTIQDYKK